MMEFINNIVGFFNLSWELFRMIPGACITVMAAVVIAVPVWRDTWKRIKEAKGPIILR